MKLDVASVSWAAEGAEIVRDVSLRCGSGTMVGLIGPNGSGKSSLLRCIYRVLRPNAGTVRLDDGDVWQMTPRMVAQRVAVVPQERAALREFSVREAVLMGRSPHQRLFDQETSRDLHAVDAAIERVGLAGFGDRLVPTLSGGEQQRVAIARALVQTPQMLVLDEPTSHLDIYHQFQVLDLVRELGVTAVVALHDLNLAAAYCDVLYLLHDGRVLTSGVPHEVLTPHYIESVYRVRATVTRNLSTGRPHVTFVHGRGDAPVC